MTELPNFSEQGYRVESLLGANPEGGRTAYRAVRIADGEPVVIKRFSLAGGDASWEGYDAHEREITMLRDLDHPRIPAYLEDFQTDSGFCLVQAFCTAPSMADRASWSPEEVATLARSILEVLDYLQRRVPPMVHRDIKPENILVDDDDQAHLVDFGLARTERASNTTMAVGTPGYMPPEQLLGREVTEATDLYAVGASLIVALTGTPSHRVSELVDTSFRFDLSVLPKSLSEDFRAWLKRLVAPQLEDRFTSADDALEALDDVGAITGPSRKKKKPKPKPQPQSKPKSKPRAQPDPSGKMSPKNTRLVMIGVGAGVLLVVGLVVVVLRDMPEYENPAPERSIHCKGPMTIDRDITMTSQVPAVVAYNGCKLTVENATLKGHTGIRMSKGAEVTVRNSTLETQSKGIEMQNGGRLELDNVEIRSAGYIAVSVSKGGEARIVGSTLSSEQSALSVHKGTVQLIDSSVTSNRWALSLGGDSVVTLKGSIVTGPTSIRMSDSQLDIQESTLKGGLQINWARSTVTGLDSATLELGDGAESTWVDLGCAPAVTCIHASEVLGDYIADLRIPISTEGGLGNPEFVQAKLADPVKACILEKIPGQQMPGYDGKARSLRCTMTGNIMAGGVASVSMNNRME